MSELKSKEQLNSIIVNESGKPYKTAIEIYWYLRSWYSPFRAEKANGKLVTLDKLYTDGIHISKEKLSQKFGVSKEAIRLAIVFLEKLGLISRGFEKKEKSVNHLVLYIWKNTPHFYNEFGVTKEQVGELKTYTSHEYIAQNLDTPYTSNLDTPYTSNLDTPVQEIWTPPVYKISTPQEGENLDTQCQLGTSVQGDRGYTSNLDTPYTRNLDTDNKEKKKEEYISLRDNIYSSNSSSSCGEKEKRKKLKIKKEKKFEENFVVEKVGYAEVPVKTSFAFGGDEVLPIATKTSSCVVDRNLALVVVPKTETVEFGEISQVVSEKDHYRFYEEIPIEEDSNHIADFGKMVDIVVEKKEAIIHELIARKDFKNELSTLAKNDGSGNVENDFKQDIPLKKLNNFNLDDPKWQDIRSVILDNFQPQMAWGIIHNMSVTPIKPNRIQLGFIKDLGFKEDQKETLRSCLKTIYGPHIEMILSRPEKDISKESLNVKVHIVDKDDKRLPEGLKAQFAAMEEEKEVAVIAKAEEEAIDVQEPLLKEGPTIACSVEYGRPYAENKWAQVRVAVQNSVYPVLSESLKHYLSQVEVIGMTNRLLKLEAPWLPYEKMQDHQGLIEEMAARYDVDLEIKNKEDGSKLYMPWTYPSHELPPLELDNILKKI